MLRDEFNLVPGESFNTQCNRMKNPHSFEGCVYRNSNHELFLYSQVGYARFTFISLANGNRLSEPIGVSGEPPYTDDDLRKVLQEIADMYEEDNLTFVGSSIEWRSTDGRTGTLYMK